jgi:deoxyuridine 5'-triphosphate nucleotidohydrolase
MQIEVKFKKIHADAQLPTRKHGNRELVSYEIDWLTKENERFEQVRPEQYAAGYRIGYPQEVSENGEVTTNIIGTGDTGYDIFAVEDKVIPARGSAVVDTGIEVAYITPGFWFKIEARSGLGFKYSVAPHPGIVDNPYRGNLGIKLYNYSDVPYEVKKGDRIAQMVFYPIVEPHIGWLGEKVDTERNEKGFGSSGK